MLNYCEDEEIDILAGNPLEKWGRFVKILKSGVIDVYINDEEVQEGYVSCPTELMQAKEEYRRIIGNFEI